MEADHFQSLGHLNDLLDNLLDNLLTGGFAEGSASMTVVFLLRTGPVKLGRTAPIPSRAEDLCARSFAICRWPMVVGPWVVAFWSLVVGPWSCACYLVLGL